MNGFHSRAAASRRPAPKFVHSRFAGLESNPSRTFFSYRKPPMNHHQLLRVTAIALSFLAASCDFDKSAFLDTAKNAYTAIYRGDPAAENAFDWRSLRINGEEAGEEYRQLATDYEKMAFRKAVLSRLKTYYTSKGWSPERIRDWHLREKGVESAQAEGKAPSGTIVFYLQKFGAEKKIIWVQNP